METNARRASPTISSGVVKWPWLPLTCLMTFALAIRVIFFNGVTGSDDLVYIGRSVEIANGIWSSANYNGALRYGFNIPAALLLRIFGTSEFTANLWPLLCSLAEILFVYLFAGRLWGRRTALFAGLVMASFPLHVAIATQIQADSVVCFFITLVYFLFYFGERENSRSAYFLCGVAMGLVFWTKELAIIALLPFLLYPLLVRRLDRNWLYVVAGGTLLLVLHLALMNWIAGDPFHLFKIVSGQVTSNFIRAGHGIDSPWFYFGYLFFDIRHTWIAVFFALPSILFVWRENSKVTDIGQGHLYVLFWLIALLAFLSFTPVSLHPLRLAMKQSNYLTIFLAPIALLSGRQIANLAKWKGLSALALVVIGGIGLAALEQADYRAFTENGKAALEFARAHPDAWIIGSKNNESVVITYSTLAGDTELPARFYNINEIAAKGSSTRSIKQTAEDGFLIIDEQTMNWGGKPMSGLRYPLACWEEYSHLKPIALGVSNELLSRMLFVLDIFPEQLNSPLSRLALNLAQPNQATVYRVKKSAIFCTDL